MSSLLDILNRRDGRAEEATSAAETSAATPAVELKLAVDNGPAEPVLETLAEPEPARAATPDPLSTFAGPAASGDATLVFTAAARQRQQRARRSTLWLGIGLAVILVGAGLAAWLLDARNELGSGDDSLFATPPPAAAVPAVQPVTRPVAKPSATRQKKAAANKRAKPPATPDESWYDTPAVEDPATTPIRIQRGAVTNPLFPKLEAAFKAFNIADFAAAEALYREVLAAEPGNVDAQLGLAAIASRGGRTAEARALYRAVLEADPKNAAAVSALSTLPADGARPLDESTLKSLLAEQPGAANLHFALGLQYAGQGRWGDAQLAFFDAVRNDPASADYAYNLAVSLDQLGQSTAAAAYYQRALDLATASSLFDAAAAADRLAALRPAGP